MAGSPRPELQELERQVRERTAESLISLNLVEEQQRQLDAMESDLRASRERYRELFLSSKDAVCITTVDGGILDMNPAALDLFGLRLEDLSAVNNRPLPEREALAYARGRTRRPGAGRAGKNDRRDP